MHIWSESQHRQIVLTAGMQALVHVKVPLIIYLIVHT